MDKTIRSEAVIQRTCRGLHHLDCGENGEERIDDEYPPQHGLPAPYQSCPVQKCSRFCSHLELPPLRLPFRWSDSVAKRATCVNKLCEPRDPLREPFARKKPQIPELMNGAAIFLDHIAVVEKVAVQPDFMLGIDFRGFHF